MRYKNYADLKDTVVKAGNVLTMDMGELRDLNGSGRLGPFVVEAISKKLASHGLSHYPTELPLNQWEKVRIYGQGSPVAEIIQVVIDVSETNDDKLREFAVNDAKLTLDKIRELLC